MNRLLTAGIVDVQWQSCQGWPGPHWTESQPPHWQPLSNLHLFAFFQTLYINVWGIAMPVSTATFERSISTLKLVKTYLKSTMDDVRLRNLGVLSVESRRAKPWILVIL